MGVVDDLVGDGFIGVGWPRIRRPYKWFGDALEGFSRRKIRLEASEDAC